MKKKNLQIFTNMADDLYLCYSKIEQLEKELEEAKHRIPWAKVEEDLDKAATYIAETRDRLTPLGIKYLLLELLREYDKSIELGAKVDNPMLTLDTEDPGPKVIRQSNIEVKTTGQLIDELIIMNQRIWMLIDKVIAGVATPEEAQSVQKYNAQRNEYVRAIDRRVNNAIQFDPNAPEGNYNLVAQKIYQEPRGPQGQKLRFA